MTGFDTARETIRTALDTISPDVDVHLDQVADAVTRYPSGEVKPYLVVAVSAPVGLDMEALDSLADTDALDLEIRVQVIAPSKGLVWRLAQDVGKTLTNLRVGAGVVKPDLVQNRSTSLLIDTTSTPHVPYLPLIYTIQTQ